MSKPVTKVNKARPCPGSGPGSLTNSRGSIQPAVQSYNHTTKPTVIQKTISLQNLKFQFGIHQSFSAIVLDGARLLAGASLWCLYLGIVVFH